MSAPSAANIRKKLRAGKKLGATELASARARASLLLQAEEKAS